MRICFVSRGSLNSFWDTYGGSDADIVFFGFQGIGEVSYEKELRGETQRRRLRVRHGHARRKKKIRRGGGKRTFARGVRHAQRHRRRI